jgi:hypothetical protein
VSRENPKLRSVLWTSIVPTTVTSFRRSGVLNILRRCPWGGWPPSPASPGLPSHALVGAPLRPPPPRCGRALTSQDGVDQAQAARDTHANRGPSVWLTPLARLWLAAEPPRMRLSGLPIHRRERARAMGGNRVPCLAPGAWTVTRSPGVDSRDDSPTHQPIASQRSTSPSAHPGPAQHLTLHDPAYRVVWSALSLAGGVCTPSLAARLAELQRRDEHLPGVCPSVTEG